MLIRYLFRTSLALAAFCGLGNAAQAAICPVTSNTNTDCGFIITIAADGSISGAAVSGANPYDGGDDALVGVVNNMTTAFTGSIALSGSGNGGGIFAFDGDGICAYTSASYCGTAATGYEGPNNTFSGINGPGTAGNVVFDVGGGILAGATSFFSLEGSPASITTGGGIGVGSVPEPSTWALMLLGFCGIGMAMRKKSVQTTVAFA